MKNRENIVLDRRSSKEERERALYQIYAQVLERQPYKSERAQLAKAEQDFLRGKLGVRRFLKELAHSQLYLDTFYYSSSNGKFLETCFKHFLGRSIRDQEEMRYYMNLLVRAGVNCLITEILDSEEYRKHFGCFTVPVDQDHQHHYSPKEYIETSAVQNEHFGQRGWSLPALYWHQLGLTCDGGVCMYIEDEPAASRAQGKNAASDETLTDFAMAL
jgi:hypothetical protein